MRCWPACGAALDRDPLLIVPTGDDIARFERDLSRDGRPAIGATIRTFASLSDEIAAATAAEVPPALTPPQRLALIRAATAATPVRMLARSAPRAGLRVGARPADRRAAGGSGLPRRRFARRPTRRATRTTSSSWQRCMRPTTAPRPAPRARTQGLSARAAAAALQASPDTWGERPVLVYGFDDLTEAQLELLAAPRQKSAR